MFYETLSSGQVTRKRFYDDVHYASLESSDEQLSKLLRAPSSELSEKEWLQLLLGPLFGNNPKNMEMLVTYGRACGYNLPVDNGEKLGSLAISLRLVAGQIHSHRGILWLFSEEIWGVLKASPEKEANFLGYLYGNAESIYQAFTSHYPQYCRNQERIKIAGLPKQAALHCQNGDLLRSQVCEPEQECLREIYQHPRQGTNQHVIRCREQYQAFYLEKMLNHYIRGLGACYADFQMQQLQLPKGSPAACSGELKKISHALLARVGNLSPEQKNLIAPELLSQANRYAAKLREAIGGASHSSSNPNSDEDSDGASSTNTEGDRGSDDDNMADSEARPLLPKAAQRGFGLFHRWWRHQEAPPASSSESALVEGKKMR